MDLSYQFLKTEDYGVLMLMVSANVGTELCPSAVLFTTNPTSTVMRFEDGRLLSESGDYTPDIRSIFGK
jgi:hypothetical protein